MRTILNLATIIALGTSAVSQDLITKSYEQLENKKFINNLVDSLKSMYNHGSPLYAHIFVDKTDSSKQINLFYFNQPNTENFFGDSLKSGYYLQSTFNIEGTLIAKKYDATQMAVLDGGQVDPDGVLEFVLVSNKSFNYEFESAALKIVPYGDDLELTKFVDDLYPDFLKGYDLLNLRE